MRALEDEEDGDGDEQADERVCEGPAGEHAEGAGDDGEGGEPVGAGVEAVGDEGGRPDLVAYPDAVHGDELVAEKADDAGGEDPADVADLPRSRSR